MRNVAFAVIVTAAGGVVLSHFIAITVAVVVRVVVAIVVAVTVIVV